MRAASGSVLGRALTRDAYNFKEMPLVMSWISLGQNIAPSLAPTIGGRFAGGGGRIGTVPLVLSAAVYAFLRYSTAGRAMRAIAASPHTAPLVGIDVARYSAIAFAAVDPSCFRARKASIGSSVP